jgi:hypothetical protein
MRMRGRVSLCEEPEGGRFERQAHADVILPVRDLSFVVVAKAIMNPESTERPRGGGGGGGESGW